MTGDESKAFWNDAARDNAAWYIATGYTAEDAAFFESGRREVDEFLRLGGLALTKADTLLEIGSGVGRMTRELARRAGRVIAGDVSGEMLARAAANLADLTNVDYLELAGDGALPVDDSSVDAVFSYITMQHVPTVSAQEKYLTEAVRVLRSGGWAYIQFRRSGILPRLLDWAGHLGHVVRGRRTMSRAWRGARVRESALLAHRSETVTVDILPVSRRHIWALLRKA